jgi:hypothetical protein
VQLASNFYAVRYEVHMAVTVKICVFLDVTSNNVIVIYQLVDKYLPGNTILASTVNINMIVTPYQFLSTS